MAMTQEPSGYVIIAVENGFVVRVYIYLDWVKYNDPNQRPKPIDDGL